MTENESFTNNPNQREEIIACIPEDSTRVKERQDACNETIRVLKCFEIQGSISEHLFRMLYLYHSIFIELFQQNSKGCTSETIKNKNHVPIKNFFY